MHIWHNTYLFRVFDMNLIKSQVQFCESFFCLLFPLAGYGNIAPSTEGGKIFCILYAIFGIPLFGFLLAGVGDQLGTIFVKSIAKVEKMFRVRNSTNAPVYDSFCENMKVTNLM